MKPRELDHLGEPALRVAGFQLWVHSRPASGAVDNPYDSWLRVTAHCGASGASVWVQGEILMLAEIADLGRQCENLARGVARAVSLQAVEPYLCIAIEPADRLGHLQLSVEITPELGTQEHTFRFEIDQTYLPEIARQCAAIFTEFREPQAGSEPHG